jgi:RNA polymerase sigma factor (TIGR02999 family)
MAIDWLYPSKTATLMSMPPSVGDMLERLRSGDDSAMGDLVQALYQELHRIASGKFRMEASGHTLQTTALVHEVYLKLVGENQRHFVDHGHFLSVAARVMRQVLVDYARAKGARKRLPIEWTTSVDVEGKIGFAKMELLDLDRALSELAVEDLHLARLIEMRYFGGMTAEESAEVLATSVHIVRHDLRLAQAWLRRKLSRAT